MKAADIVGYRFHPSDKDLVSHHLRRRLLGIQETKCLIPVLNIYDHQPWDLHKLYNEKSDEKSCGKECFFFCPRGNGGGSRTSRKAGGGFWKDTSRKRIIKAGKTVGIKRILVFYEGKQKDSRKTDWVMHEYHLNALNEGAVCDLGAFALCCFKRKPMTKKKEKSPVSVCEANLSSPSSSTAIVEVEVPNQELQIENAVIDTNGFNVDELVLLQNTGYDEETGPTISNDSINPMFHHQMEPTDDTTVTDKNEFNVDDLLQNIGDDDEDLRLLQNTGYDEETSPAISNDSINHLFHHQMDELLLPNDHATAFNGEQDYNLIYSYDFDKIEDVLCCPDFNELWTLYDILDILNDPKMRDSFESIFPKDDPKNTRFSINFFTSIGLGGITDDLREHLKNASRRIMQHQTDNESDDSKNAR